jgi:chromosome segregation ATPase
VNFGDVVDVGLRVAFALGIPGAVIWFIRDRRKSRASDEVAERTIGADVRIRDVGALEAHIAYVERAFEVERESKDRRIADQDHQIRALQQGRADDAERIADLRAEVQELKDQVQMLTALTRRLTSDEPGEMT